MRAFPVEVDGAPAGAVGNGKELMLALPPGSHRIRCGGGPVLRVRLGPGETVRVTVGPGHVLSETDLPDTEPPQTDEPAGHRPTEG
jgi:hypothetical protein